jgi:hypothetical protein
MIVGKGGQVLFLIIATIFIVCAHVYMHENAHKQISLYFGCEDVELHYGLTSTSQCIKYSNITTQEMVNEEYKLHSINEIVSYNLDAIIEMIFILALVIILVK